MEFRAGKVNECRVGRGQWVQCKKGSVGATRVGE